MALFDRYIITSNSSLPLPGAVIVPSADLSSLWFKDLFDWFSKAFYKDVVIASMAVMACMFVFGLPFLLRAGAGGAVYGC